MGKNEPEKGKKVSKKPHAGKGLRAFCRTERSVKLGKGTGGKQHKIRQNRERSPTTWKINEHLEILF